MDWIMANWKELVGYLAPLFIILSMMQSQLKWIRIYMILGCLTFVLYGFLVNAMPVVVANALIAVVTVFYFLKGESIAQNFSIVDVTRGVLPVVEKFVQEHQKELSTWFPSGTQSIREGGYPIFFFMRHAEPVGIFSYRMGENGVAEILVDYVNPKYRDDRTEKYLYCRNEGYLKQLGFRQVMIRTDVAEVQKEMAKMGFKVSKEDPNLYTRSIA